MRKIEREVMIALSVRAIMTVDHLADHCDVGFNRMGSVLSAMMRKGIIGMWISRRPTPCIPPCYYLIKRN